MNEEKKIFTVTNEMEIYATKFLLGLNMTAYDYLIFNMPGSSHVSNTLGALFGNMDHSKMQMKQYIPFWKIIYAFENANPTQLKGQKLIHHFNQQLHAVKEWLIEEKAYVNNEEWNAINDLINATEDEATEKEIEIANNEQCFLILIEVLSKNWSHIEKIAKVEANRLSRLIADICYLSGWKDTEENVNIVFNAMKKVCEQEKDGDMQWQEDRKENKSI